MNYQTAAIVADHAEAQARFTAQQAIALIRASDIETELRLKLANGPYEGSIRTAIKNHLADVTRLAVEVLDDLAGHEGFETAHDELQAELEAVDIHRLWTATDKPEAFMDEPGDYFTTPRVTSGLS